MSSGIRCVQIWSLSWIYLFFQKKKSIKTIQGKRPLWHNPGSTARTENKLQLHPQSQMNKSMTENIINAMLRCSKTEMKHTMIKPKSSKQVFKFIYNMNQIKGKNYNLTRVNLNSNHVDESYPLWLQWVCTCIQTHLTNLWSKLENPSSYCINHNV